MFRTPGISLVVIGATVVVRSALADDGAPGPGGHRGPPPEAIEACKTLSKGDACTVPLHDHSLAGTCQGPEGKPLACRPNEPPPPPPEAIDACQGLSDSAACSFTIDGHSVKGACHAPQGKPLACVPSDFPPPPPPDE